MKQNILILLGIAVILGTLGIIGNSDYKTAQNEFEQYCSNVFGSNPIWPDYKKVGAGTCNERGQ